MLLLKNYNNLYTHPEQSIQIIEIMKKFLEYDTILVDATAGMGGDSTFFCKNFKFVYCLEINLECIKYLEHNLESFHNKDIFNINCIEGLKIIKYDCIYLDPPWGGKNYKFKKYLDLFIEYNTNLINIIDYVESLYFSTKYIFIKVPLNFNIKNMYKINWKYKIYPIFKNLNDNLKNIFNIIVFFK